LLSRGVVPVLVCVPDSVNTAPERVYDVNSGNSSDSKLIVDPSTLVTAPAPVSASGAKTPHALSGSGFGTSVDARTSRAPFASTLAPSAMYAVEWSSVSATEIDTLMPTWASSAVLVAEMRRSSTTVASTVTSPPARTTAFDPMYAVESLSDSVMATPADASNFSAPLCAGVFLLETLFFTKSKPAPRIPPVALLGSAAAVFSFSVAVFATTSRSPASVTTASTNAVVSESSTPTVTAIPLDCESTSSSGATSACTPLTVSASTDRSCADTLA
jgi:hypothetical protein